MIENIAVIFALAVFVEGFIEYFVARPNAKQPWIKYVGALVGILVALAYKADLLALVFGAKGISPYVGQVITGIILGRGSNYLNDLISRIRNPKTLMVLEKDPAVIDSNEAS